MKRLLLLCMLIGASACNAEKNPITEEQVSLLTAFINHMTKENAELKKQNAMIMARFDQIANPTKKPKKDFSLKGFKNTVQKLSRTHKACAALLIAIIVRYTTKKEDKNYLKLNEIFSPRPDESFLEYLRRLIDDRLIGFYLYKEKKGENYTGTITPNADDTFDIELKKGKKGDHYGVIGTLHANLDTLMCVAGTVGLFSKMPGKFNAALETLGVEWATVEA